MLENKYIESGCNIEIFRSRGWRYVYPFRSLDLCPESGRREDNQRVLGLQQPFASCLSLCCPLDAWHLLFSAQLSQRAKWGCCELCSWNYQCSDRAV